MQENKLGINKNTLDNSVLKTIILCSCGLISAGAAILYAVRRSLPDLFPLGFLVGSVAGLANLYFLSMIITATLNPEGVRKARAIIGAVGINATLAVFIYTTYKQMVNGVGLMAGFTVALVVLIAGFYVSIKKKGE